MDANYTKMDKIDPLFYSHSNRIDLKEETRIKATSEEALEFEEAHRLSAGAPPPNFISDIFFLTISISHYGFLKTVQTYNNFPKQMDDLQRHADWLTQSLGTVPVC